MADRADFQTLVERAMIADGHTHMRPVVEKELLHYDILFALDREGLLDQLTFRGGTSLRLCYGAVRFSEDLDFAGGRDFHNAQLLNMKSCLEDHIAKRYGLDVTVRERKETTEGESEHRRLRVARWQIRIVTSPQRRDLPKQMIRIEIVNIPAYTREPRPLRSNYDFLPDGYTDLLVMAESLEEIMADKLVSLIDCTTHVRYRDIWDLRWLKSHGAEVNIELIRNKLRDYAVEDYDTKADRMIQRLPGIVHGKDFRDQMSRFIPLDIQERTLRKEKFLVFLEYELTHLLTEAGKSAVSPP